MLTVTKSKYGNVIDLERYAKDGRLTEPSDGKKYKLREMINRAKSLGRSLSDTEAEQYRIK